MTLPRRDAPRASECSVCFYWAGLREAMARIDPSWSDKPTPAHSCPDKAKEN